MPSKRPRFTKITANPFVPSPPMHPQPTPVSSKRLPSLDSNVTAPHCGSGPHRLRNEGRGPGRTFVPGSLKWSRSAT